jgi:hypothetical protein
MGAEKPHTHTRTKTYHHNFFELVRETLSPCVWGVGVGILRDFLFFSFAQKDHFSKTEKRKNLFKMIFARHTHDKNQPVKPATKFKQKRNPTTTFWFLRRRVSIRFQRAAVVALLMRLVLIIL